MECKHFIIYTKGGGRVGKNGRDRECDRERDKIVGNGVGGERKCKKGEERGGWGANPHFPVLENLS